MELNASYWNSRYQNNEIGWDLGKASTPIIQYISQLSNKEIKILIPGCGHAYEAEYLFLNGFKNVFILDFAEKPLNNFHKRVPEFPKNQLLNADFFTHQGTYDLILEQTLFCAINPSDRQKYADKIYELLAPQGKLVGLLFNRTFPAGPPFGGSKDEYLNYFSQFSSVTMETCYNSIEPRKNTELFITIQK